jgi:hypothetical protein
MPELLDIFHALVQSPDRRRLGMTGSSAGKRRRGGVDRLAGRAVVRTMHPFVADARGLPRRQHK